MRDAAAASEPGEAPAAGATPGSPEELGRRRPPWLFYYDGDCGFCRGVVRWLRRLDLARRVAWVPYQELDVPPAALSWPDLDRAAYLDRGGRLEAGFYAFRRLTLGIVALMPLAPLLWLPGVNLVGEAVYGLVARNRRRLSRAGCETEPPP